MTDKTHKGLCVNSDLGLVFIGTPKNASASIRRCLGAYNSNYFDLMECGGLEGKAVFAIVRNPLLRFVSGYLEIFKRLTLNDNYEHKQFYSGLIEIADEQQRLERFVELCEEATPDVHVKKQVHFLTDDDGNLLAFDDILLFENLESEFNSFCLKHGKNIKMERMNQHSHRASITCIQILRKNLSLTQRINSLYQDDWNLYADVLLRKLKDLNNPVTEQLGYKRRRGFLSDYFIFLLGKFREKFPRLRLFLRFMKNAFRSLRTFWGGRN